MRSFLRNRRFKNFAFKTDVLCSCLLLNSKAAALIGTARQKDITEIPINGALKFALVFCGNNMYFANTNSSGTQAFVRAVSAPEKTVTCTTIQNKLIIQNNDENAKAYMCKIF